MAQTGANSQSTVKLCNNSIMWPSFAPLRPKSPHVVSWPFCTYSPLHSSFSPSAFSSQSHSLSPPAFSSQSYSPFTLCNITGNISKCFGCRNKYAKNPNPPEDMCIKHQDWREFAPSGSDIPQSRYGYVYYHFHPQCVWLHCNWFFPPNLFIPPDLVTQLGPTHKDRLRFLFDIHL